MNKYFDIDDEGKKTFIVQAALRTGLPTTVVEKDLWVTIMLQIVFQLPFADRLLFKGGSSLSKIWNLIERMSEDIDLAYDDHFGIFEGNEPTIKQIKKLRKQSSLFVQNDFCKALKESIHHFGLDDWCSVEAQPNGTGDGTYPEPLQIYVSYKTLFPENFSNLNTAYVKPIVMLEIGSRSLIEPTGMAKVKSIVAQTFPTIDTDMITVDIKTAMPQKTFLEKAFLLHEMFSTDYRLHANRKSRHLYDLEKMMDKDFAIHAVDDDILWNSINHHRSRFTPVHGVNYDSDLRKSIMLTPPDSYIAEWEKDYEYMRNHMIYDKNALAFCQLLRRMHELEERFRG